MLVTRIASIVVALTIAPTLAVADDTFQPRDVFDLEYATNPAISPDGSRIVYQRVAADIMKDRFSSSLWMIDLSVASSGEIRHRPLLQGDGSYSNPVWSPNGDRLLFSTSSNGQSQLRLLFMDTLQQSIVTSLPSGARGPRFSPDGETIAFSMFTEGDAASPAKLPKKPEGAEWAPAVKVIDELIYRRDGGGYTTPGTVHVFVVPTEGGTARQVTSGDHDTGGSLAWLPDGDLIVSMNPVQDADYDPSESSLYRVDVATGEYTQLTNRDGEEGSPRVSPDGRIVAYTGFEDRMLGTHTNVLSVLDLETGETRDLSQDLDRSVGAYRFAPDTDQIWFTYSDHGIGRLATINRAGEVVVQAENLGGTTLGRPYSSGSFDVGPKGLFAYTVTNPTRPGDLVVARGRQGRAREVFRTQLNEDLLAHKTVPDAELIVTKSVGGLEVEGWLVLPPDHEPGDRHPMILEIHGGPFANYGPRFSAEVQLFASAGYAVLYSNPRGSTSYGADFANEIHHNYPGQDYDDLMAITDAAIATGHIDADRLFVTGGSGGGVLTSWIVGKTDRFAAAVVAKPVINWTSFVLTADAYTYFPAYWFSAMPWDDPMQYWNRSPLSLVGNVTTPTMLLTGEADYRTPMSESEQYYQALRLLKVPTRLVRIPEASHGIASRPSHLLAKVAEVLRWFETHDPGE